MGEVLVTVYILQEKMSTVFGRELQKRKICVIIGRENSITQSRFKTK